MKKDNPKVIDKLTVRSLSDIYKAIEPFLPKSDGLLRYSLVEGYKSLVTRTKFATAIENLDISEFGGIPPTLTVLDINGYKFRLDTLINNYMGAKRDGLMIYWELVEGKYKFDVETGKVERV